VALDENTLGILKQWPRLTTLELGIFTTFTKSLLSLAIKPQSLDNNNYTNNSITTTTTTTTSWWPGLKELYLYPSVDLDDTTLAAFIKSHPHIRVLDFMYTEQLTDDSLHAMVVGLPDLTSISWIGKLNQISPNGVRQFVLNSPPTFECLTLGNCTRIKATDFPETRMEDHFVRLDKESIAKIKSKANELETSTS
jgi:hypothetical protein